MGNRSTQYRYVGAASGYAAWEAALTVKDPLLAGDRRIFTDTGVEYYTDGTSWYVERRSGAEQTYGLARNMVAVAAGQTYNSTEILGFRCLTPGSGNWSETPVGGSAVTGIVPTGFLAGQVYPEHLSSITVGTGGAALVYIP